MKDPVCSFCGTDKYGCTVFVAGSGHMICDWCVDQATVIVGRTRREIAKKQGIVFLEDHRKAKPAIKPCRPAPDVA